MPDFFIRNRKKIRRGGGGGYTQIFGVYSKYNTAWRGGVMPDFFMCTRKILGRGEFIPKFLVCTQRILLGGGGAMLIFFMCN